MLTAMLAGGLLSAYAGIYGIPILGAAEQLSQIAYLLWMAVLAILLLLERQGQQPKRHGEVR